MQVLYAYFKCKDATLNKHEKELFHSIDKSYELYHLYLLLILDIVKFAESRIDLAKKKRIPTEADLNPNLRFVNNRVIKQIFVNEQLNRYVTQTGISWIKHPEIIKGLYEKIIDSLPYDKYMHSKEDSFDADKRFVETIYDVFVTNYESIYSMLEEESVYWNDEIEFIISMVIKTIKNFKVNDNEDTPLLPLFKNDDDSDFTKSLFRKVIVNHSDYEKIVDTFTTNWELERIAFMDRLLMEMAIAELLEFPSIPIKVTLNEYIDLAKFYSTKKSHVFINGILDKIIHQFKKENKIVKTGRGLMGEIPTS